MLAQRKIPFRDCDLEADPIRGERILEIIAGKRELYIWEDFEHSKSATYFLLDDPKLTDEEKIKLLTGGRSGRLRSGTVIIGDTVMSGVKKAFLEKLLSEKNLIP